MTDMFDELHEECGVFGCYRVPDAASITYYGLHSLQHRGQEASGMAVWDGEGIRVFKGKGLTVDVFQKENLDHLPGDLSIGHVRYSTAGGQERENIQPIAARGHKGHVAIAHNGQIVNDRELRLELENQGCIFQGTSDSEVLLHLIMKESGPLEERIAKAAARCVGAFSFLVIDGDDLYAVRDRWGLRPLSYVKYDSGYCVSSETCAFEVMGVYGHTDVKPGEMVRFHKGLVTKKQYASPDPHMCAMEYIYFARPDSEIEGMNVHDFRRRTGEVLAQKDREAGFEADIVIGVPDSSLSAAIGYAEVSGLPYEMGLVKNRFVSRTFIQPTQALRDRGVRMKLSPVEDVIRDKSVVLIDDSIVRGTTSRRIVRLLKDAGAKEVHVRIASPIITNPCFYGIDTSTREELIGSSKSCQEIEEYIEADSLRFMETEDLEKVYPHGLCTACFDGKYCTPLFSHEESLTE